MMKEEEKLMKLDLQKENKKIEMNQINGIKLSFFKLNTNNTKNTNYTNNTNNNLNFIHCDVF